MILSSETTPVGVSRLFDAMGLGGLDIAWLFIVILVLLIVMVVLLAVNLKRYRDLKTRYEKFMTGKRASSLEERMQSLIRDVDKLKDASREYANDIDLLFSKHQSAIQKIGLLKYDAFKEMGGNLSFVLVLLDEQNNGVMVNSVHSNNGCYSYTKRIKAGRCDLELSPEEQETLRRAMGSA